MSLLKVLQAWLAARWSTLALSGVCSHLNAIFFSLVQPKATLLPFSCLESERPSSILLGLKLPIELLLSLLRSMLLVCGLSPLFRSAGATLKR